MVIMGHPQARSIPGTPAGIEPVAFLNPRFPTLGIEAMTLQALRERVPQRHLRHSSRPQFHQLILVTRGRTPHDIDFVRHDLRAGCVLHARPGQVQQLVLQSPAKGVVLLFAPEFVPEQSAGRAPPEAVPPLDAAVPGGLIVPAAAERMPLARAFEAILAEYRRTDGSPLSAGVLRHLLLALLLMLARASEPRPGTPLPPGAAARVFARFAQSVESGFGSSRSVADHAQRLGYSTKTLLRACQAVAGVPPKEVIERRVILEAKRLLAHTRQPVGTVATETGFSEATNFVKFFRRREGMSPTRFRALHGRPD
jgi:AraC-like DNA-binding protein